MSVICYCYYYVIYVEKCRKMLCVSVCVSWFFGRMDREESSCILQWERDSGVFLVRESMSINGDYVLCVKLVAAIC